MMKEKIFFGTGNISKLHRIQAIVRDLHIEIVGIDELDINLEVMEDGKNVRQNAIKKAKAYYYESKMPTFSIDSGLYIEKFSEEKQPGLYVRRINGKRATDEEMINYYKKELEKIGGLSEGKWISTIAFFLDQNNIKTYELVEERIFTSNISSTRKEGWPLSSMAIDPTFNKYVSEITGEERQKLQEKTDKKLFDIFKNILSEIKSSGTIA